MAEIAILPLSEHAQFGMLFAQPRSAEGSYGWFESLAATTLDPGEDAVFVVGFEDGAAKLALPLARKGKSMRALTAPYTTLYRPALCVPRLAHALGARAREYVAGALRLDAMDPNDPGVAAFLEGLMESGLAAARYRHFANWFEPVATFDAYWAARPSRLKATVRRKLAQAHTIGFRCYRENFDEAVAIYEDIHRASWKKPEPHPRFIADMVARLSREGFVRMGVMTLEDKPVAAQIWLVCARKATIFKLAHREDAANHSPGTLLTHWMLSKLVGEEDLEEIDFGRGDDTYKRDWMSQSRARIGVVAGNWRNAAGLVAIAREILPTRLSAALRGNLR